MVVSNGVMHAVAEYLNPSIWSFNIVTRLTGCVPDVGLVNWRLMIVPY